MAIVNIEGQREAHEGRGDTTSIENDVSFRRWLEDVRRLEYLDQFVENVKGLKFLIPTAVFTLLMALFLKEKSPVQAAEEVRKALRGNPDTTTLNLSSNGSNDTLSLSDDVRVTVGSGGGRGEKSKVIDRSEQVGGGNPPDGEIGINSTIVTGSNEVNLRAGSATNTDVVLKMGENQQMVVMNIVTMNDGDWYYVRLTNGDHAGLTGYVRYDKVEKLQPSAVAALEAATSVPQTGPNLNPVVEGSTVEQGATLTPGPFNYYGDTDPARVAYATALNSGLETLSPVAVPTPSEATGLTQDGKPLVWGFNPESVEFMGTTADGDVYYAEFLGIFGGDAQLTVEGDANTVIGYSILIPASNGTYVKFADYQIDYSPTADASYHNVMTYGADGATAVDDRTMLHPSQREFIAILQNDISPGEKVIVGGIFTVKPGESIENNPLIVALRDGTPIPADLQVNQKMGVATLVFPEN